MVLDHVDVRDFFVEIDQLGYSKESVSINHAANECLDQFIDLKLFYDVYTKKPL